MWREFPDHPAVNLQKRCEISRFWSGFLRQPKHDSQHSRRIPTFRLKNRRTFAPFTTCGGTGGRARAWHGGLRHALARFGVGNTLATFAKPIAGDCELSSQERLPRFLGDQQKKFHIMEEASGPPGSVN